MAEAKPIRMDECAVPTTRSIGSSAVIYALAAAMAAVDTAVWLLSIAASAVCWPWRLFEACLRRLRIKAHAHGQKQSLVQVQ